MEVKRHVELNDRKQFKRETSQDNVDRWNDARSGCTAAQALHILSSGGLPAWSFTSPGVGLPTPPFPRQPERYGDVEPSPKYLARDGNPDRTRVTLPMIARELKEWFVPYVGSRIRRGDFNPIISYLFTEWKCNLDRHYCWAFGNRVKGITEDLACGAIDWLYGSGCLILALVGGECSSRLTSRIEWSITRLTRVLSLRPHERPSDASRGDGPDWRRGGRHRKSRRRFG